MTYFFKKSLFESQRERKRQQYSICWFATTARARSSQNQEPKTLSRSSTWMTGTQSTWAPGKLDEKWGQDTDMGYRYPKQRPHCYATMPTANFTYCYNSGFMHQSLSHMPCIEWVFSLNCLFSPCFKWKIISQLLNPHVYLPNII